ncbi:ATP-binding protein [Demequina mangrovi]|nr:ATP-binding protein [Demequina mangrovi]
MVPILVLLSAVSYITLTAANSYSVNSNAERLIEVATEARTTEQLIQEERTAALNFVHTIQDTQEKLAEARADVEVAYGTLVERVEAADSAKADSLLDFANEQLDRQDGQLLAGLRSVTLAAPEEEGGWLVLPTEDEVAQLDQDYARAARQLDTLSTTSGEALKIPFAALAYAIENEAFYVHRLLAESADYRDQLDEIFPAVDAGLDHIATEAAEVELTDDNAAALAAVSAGHELRDSLPQIRAGVRAAAVSPATVISYYTQVIDTFVGSADAIALAIPDREIVGTIQAYAAIDQLIERIRFEGDTFNRMIRTGAFTATDVASSRSYVERTTIALEDAQDRADNLAPAIEVPELASTATSSSSFVTTQNHILNGLDSSLIAAQDVDWPALVQAELDVYEPLREEMWDRTTEAISANTVNAASATWITLGAAVAAVVGSLLITFVIARRITVPLRRLTTTATAVREELPRLVERVAMPGEEVDVSEVQIRVESQDEVGRLAEAFNGVNAATLEIAREQAALRSSISEMFVNVARRDQLLLNRQLASIDEMERTEDDPDRLTRLFALDHLATRMRRNSESLLVLAGIDTGRRIRRAMPLSDVVRTASSEIELYERIDLELVVDPAMHGHQALTAAHLFAELLENATVFSDPGSRVIVRTGRTEDGFTVEVIDTGIGMTTEELAEANARVQSSAASEILGAQRLGLFVVGRIARRVGAQVALSSVEGEGTVATILLPSALFEAVGGDTAQPKAAAPAPSAPATAPTVAPAGGSLPSRQAPAAPELPATPPTSAPAASAPYAPSSMVAGASLSGRAAEPEYDEDSIPMPQGIEALIAADAAEAPVAQPVDGADLTSGTSESGLPTRRRRSDDAEKSGGSEEAEKVIGLPVRATAAQLSALDAEAAAFTPSVSPAEIDPQTAEERASVFRGFRSRRDAVKPEPAADLPEAVPPVMSEALGEPTAPVEAVEPTQAVEPELPQRSIGGAFAAFDGMRRAAAADQGQRAEEPALEPEAEVPAFEPEPAPEPEPVVPALPTFSVPKLATTEIPLVHRDEARAEQPEPEAPAAPASPLARSPYGAPFSAPTAETAQVPPLVEPALEEPAPDTFSVPILEPDTDESAADELAVAPQAEAIAEEPQPEPAPEPEAPAMPWSSVISPEQSSAPAPAPQPAPWQPTAPWASAEPVPAPEQSEPVAAAPEQPAPVAAEEPASQAQRAPWLDAAAFASAAAERDGGYGAEAAEAEPEAPVAPFAAAPAAPAPTAGVTDALLDDPYTYGEPTEPSMDDIIAQASGEESGHAGFFGRLFGRGARDEETASPVSPPPARAPFAPIDADTASFAPVEASEPEAESAWPMTTASEQWPTAPAPEPEPEPVAEIAPEPEPAASFAPEPEPVPAPRPAPEPAAFTPEPAPTSFAPESPVFEPQSGPVGYSPDELAQPSGWASAGASALAAAGSDNGAGGYQPVVDTEHSSGRVFSDDDADMTRMAFSELSSLSELRPTVEKTKAGLQKRRSPEAAPVEVKPITEEVSLAPKERDADAVRSRFSSFYSGTQRARTDAAGLDLRSMPQPANEQ